MERYQSLSQFIPTSSPLVLTIGNFDGVHLGHQHVIRKATERAKSIEGKSVALTFSNHPSEVLPGRSSVPLICTPEHKIALLSQLSIDYLIQLPFTREFSKLTAQAFIDLVRAHIPFHSLVLGYDARFGKDRTGDRKTVFQIAEKTGFLVEYAEPVTRIIGKESDESGHTPVITAAVSSKRIREAIRKGNFIEAEELLGRPYSILSTVVNEDQRVIFDLSNLCLPPVGVYEILLKANGEVLPGIGQLVAREDSTPVFEVRLSEKTLPHSLGKMAEIFPQKFLGIVQQKIC